MALAAISGWYLSGLAVTVAVVVYPAFARVGNESWADYHRAHQRAILAAVGPAWVLEGGAALGWLVTGAGRAGLSGALPVIHAVAAGLTVLLTLAGAVPAHGRLTPAFTAPAHRRLLAAHRARTGAWVTAALAASAGLLT